MKVNGIVAEYNPFHNGHAYQLQHAKEANDADYTIIVMSGNFMQRGAPALLDKFTRTKMALENGADLVLELPVPYALAPAENFAMGGVALLTALVYAPLYLLRTGDWRSTIALALIFPAMLWAHRSNFARWREGKEQTFRQFLFGRHEPQREEAGE